MSVRLLIQQCISAQLTLPTDEVLAIARGMIVFVCFNKEAEEEKVSKASQTVLKVKLSEMDGESKRKSIKETGGDILIIPQATLGGKLKGNSVQYHGNIAPDKGKGLYEQFCNELTSLLPDNKIHFGVYGARQVLSSQTNGPYSHCFDI
eukprot:TRINITY_DN14857_c0_g1_i1.p1 TRINITY_DN14857_c0_g1~~TRINITY_DN14857_c0_g1_i1.p1  ORF type:complete len:149 (+),score=9.17 TRINITY_DN14857_c0_g1_i1:181-627(+)